MCSLAIDQRCPVATTQPALNYVWLRAFRTRFSMFFQCEAPCFVGVIRSRSGQ